MNLFLAHQRHHQTALHRRPAQFVIRRQKSFYYLLIEDVILTQFNPAIIRNQRLKDPYSWYYENHYLSEDNSSGQKYKKYDINKFYIGNDQYNMTYHPNARKNYDWYMSFEENVEKMLSIEQGDGPRRVLPVEEYVELLETFGQQHGFVPLKSAVIYGEED